MKRRAFLLGSAAALTSREAEAAFNIFNATSVVGGGTTFYTATGPSTGTTGSPSANFTVTIGSGVFSGAQTITIVDSPAGGTFTPSVGAPGTSSVTVTPPVGTTSFTFTYNAVSNGVKTLIFTDAQGWIDPAPLTYTASALPVGLLQSTPAGSLTLQVNQSGGNVGNSDGTTIGFSTFAGLSMLQWWFNFPANQYYQFVVPAFSPSWPGGQANPLAVLVDQIPIPADGGNASNLNYFLYFISNAGPSQNYSFTAPVTAGWHSIQISMNFLNSGKTAAGIPSNNLHVDRLNIIGTGTPLPAEPLPRTRDPGQFPMSSWHFMNTPFGANAQWLALSDPIAKVVNGTGGNGANISPSVLTDSVNNWFGGSNDPVWTLYNPNDGSTPSGTHYPSPTVGLQYPFRGPAGLFPTFGSSDKGITVTDTTNPRFKMQGGGLFGWGDRTVNFGLMFLQDSYNLNHAMPQLTTNGRGILTVADLESGAILHRLQGGLGAYNGNLNIGYSFPSQISSSFNLPPQTSDFSGLIWPGANSDFDWIPQRYNNPVGPPYNSTLGIPPSVTKPGGLNAGTSMVWDCFQHYGLFLNVSAGNANSPGITLYVEGEASGHPIYKQISWSTIVPNLSVLSNPAPIVLNTANPQGYGGGNVIVPVLPGLVQGYPSLGLPPYTFPSSPVGIPIQCATNAAAVTSSGVASGNVNSNNLGLGTFLFVFHTFDRVNATTVQFTSMTDTATVGGTANAYTIIQPAAVVNVNPIALSFCPSLTRAITTSAHWTTTMAPGGQVNYIFYGGFYRPAPTTGSTSLRVSNTTSTASSVTGLSVALAGVVAGDLIIAAVRTNNYAEFVLPAGFTTLVYFQDSQSPFGSYVIFSQVAPASGTVTINPTWVGFATGGALVAAAFANANVVT